MNDIQAPAVKSSRSPALWWRIAALLIFVFASTLLLISFLNYSNYRKTYLNLNQTRYLVSLKELRQTIEYGMNIGLPPSSNTNLMPALNDLLKRQDGIRYIAVADDSGKILSTTPLSSETSRNWNALQESTANESYWQSASPSTFELGMPFTNNFGQKAGVVVIGYDRPIIEKAIGNMLRGMAFDFIVNLAILTLLTFVIVYLLTAKFSATIAKLSQVIDTAMRTNRPCEINDAAIDPATVKDLTDFVNLSQQAARELDALEHELKPRASGANMQEGLA